MPCILFISFESPKSTRLVAFKHFVTGPSSNRVKYPFLNTSSQMVYWFPLRRNFEMLQNFSNLFVLRDKKTIYNGSSGPTEALTLWINIKWQINIAFGTKVILVLECVCVFVIYSSSTYSRRSFRRTIIVSCFTSAFFCSQSSNDALVTRMSVESFSTQYALTNGHCAY